MYLRGYERVHISRITVRLDKESFDVYEFFEADKFEDSDGYNDFEEQMSVSIRVCISLSSTLLTSKKE